jgi:PAS domain S-box-containing protein
MTRGGAARPTVTFMPRPDDWSGLFATAFEQSRNAMILADAQRRMVDVNPALLSLLGRKKSGLTGRPVFSIVAGGPQATEEEWAGAMAEARFSGVTELLHADGRHVAVQWAASTETVTGRRLVLFVVLRVSRWGARFRRGVAPEEPPRALTPRQREIVHLVALGASGPEIGDELNISHETVRTHVRNAMEKLGARSRAHLVAKALGDGLTLD